MKKIKITKKKTDNIIENNPYCQMIKNKIIESGKDAAKAFCLNYFGQGEFCDKVIEAIIEYYKL